MVKLRRHELAAEARRRNCEQLSRLGADLREARTRRRLTQAEVGDRVGLGRSTVGAIERGPGGGHTLDTWQRLGLAVGRPLRIELGRDVLEAPADAGHLAIQELLLRLRRAAGFTGTFELPIRPADTRHAIDVCLRGDGQRLLRLCEAWNTFGDVGAAARSFAWKLAKAEEVAIAIGGERPYRVRGVWVVRATARNRALVGRYPAVFGARFPGSSVGWVRALSEGMEPPTQPGLAWCDLSATRLFAWRRRSVP